MTDMKKLRQMHQMMHKALMEIAAITWETNLVHPQPNVRQVAGKLYAKTINALVAFDLTSGGRV